VSGTIKTLGADFNSQVRQGQVIAQLDPSLFDTQVAQERATVARLNAEVERARVQAEDAKVKLGRAKDLSAQELIAKSDLDARGLNRQRCGGIGEIGRRPTPASAGLAQSGASEPESHGHSRADRRRRHRAQRERGPDRCREHAGTDALRARAEPEGDARQRQRGRIGHRQIQNKQPVRFRVDAYPNETFNGTVSQVRLQPVVEQNVVSYVTVIDVPNPDLKLKPGMTAAVTIETGRADEAIKVPNAALRFRPTPEAFEALGQKPPEPRQRSQGQSARGPQAGTDGQGQRRDRAAGDSQRGAVWVLAQNTLKRVPVQVGLSDGTQTVVSSRRSGGRHACGDRHIHAVGVDGCGTERITADSAGPAFRRWWWRSGGGGGNNAGGNNGGRR
jgi:HlyD family secretion protein